ncbi:FkbM family methyltransferase [Methanocaldococcus sp. FS406-22]|uniref:FkbM family methyltransferase n=1 Tax=Methanocaldococcus sp. (strain FS406-22) TaxID=644281 RepID=UPI0018DBEDA8|nr:FkbM family methyltransferase [Methanocaldococcus sp. FS406-22]
MSIRSTLGLINELWRYSNYNIDFLIRISILELWNCLKGRTKLDFFKKYDFKFKTMLNKEFLFNTPYGKFIASSIDGWYAMQNNYEKYVQEVFNDNYQKYKMNKDKIFLDIGANIGRFTVLNALRGYKVYAFEPAEPIFKQLERNVKLNNLNNVVLIPYALSDEENEFEFEYFEGFECSSRIREKRDEFSKYAKILKIKTKRLDEIVKEYNINIDKIRLIKIDVEGHEYGVIKGGIKTFKKLNNVDITMEIWDSNPNKEKTLKLMRELGFKCEQISKDDWHFWK